MQCERTIDIKVHSVSCSDEDRHLPPTKEAIEAMKESLTAHGQILPIGVYPVARNSYRLIVGATRFRAASELGWENIRASIWIGTTLEFQLYELVENVNRRELTGKQRREMRAKIKDLQRQRLANVEPSKGGRGHRGGVSEAARQAGVSETTARRRRTETQTETKPRQNTTSGEVSAVAKSRQQREQKITSSLPIEEFSRFKALCDQLKLNIADEVRYCIRAELDHRIPRQAAE
jgi:hypothetical protein